MTHMKNLRFNLEVESDEKIVLIMNPEPEVCCMQCLGKFLMSFAEGLLRKEEQESGELH